MKTIQDFQKAKNANKKISVVTCYDTWSALIIDDTSVDAVMVGDSAAMVMHGFETTVNADLDMMCGHVAAVRRGLKSKFLIGDMPFLSNRQSLDTSMLAVDRLMKAGSQAVKMEGAEGNMELIEHLVKSGVPVMGHLGLTPQSYHQLGGFKQQGTTEQAAQKILHDALQLQKAGCFSIVLEMIPTAVAKRVTDELTIPTIGIGAGPHTSGQVLVLQDLLGLNKNFTPTFVKKYLNGCTMIHEALNLFDQEIKEGSFPEMKEERR